MESIVKFIADLASGGHRAYFADIRNAALYAKKRGASAIFIYRCTRSYENLFMVFAGLFCCDVYKLQFFRAAFNHLRQNKANFGGIKLVLCDIRLKR